ncbi:hypothetical protein HDU99_002594, partial [Rhizoclosmatium hyalinum]
MDLHSLLNPTPDDLANYGFPTASIDPHLLDIATASDLLLMSSAAEPVESVVGTGASNDQSHPMAQRSISESSTTSSSPTASTSVAAKKGMLFECLACGMLFKTKK